MATYDLTKTTPSQIVTGDVLNCPYSGRIISVTLPKGSYKLQVEGAQGSSLPSNYNPYQGSVRGVGGKGGLSLATLELSESETLYLVVGGSGSNNQGGYNGGALGHKAGGAGGGASHVAFRTGLLADLSSYKNDVILVAGGGGGAQYCDGGSGGGANCSGENGPLAVGGNSVNQAWGATGRGGTVSSGYAFGVGGSGATGSDGLYGGSGGGGYFGGFGATSDISRVDDYGGGGGSGYAASFLKTISGQSGVRFGSGYIKITVLNASKETSIYVNIGGVWKTAASIKVY